ncbi:MAG: deoxyribose-phosphate aldolase [Candidatus Heimdallarchaeota archaeon]
MSFSKEEFAKFIDHSVLRPTTGEKDIIRVAQETKDWNFASMTVNPVWVKQTAHELKNTGIDVTACISFPFGALPPDQKAYEAREAVKNGATEIDMVANIGAILDKDWARVIQDITAVVESVPNIPVKVIIETAYLTDVLKKEAAICVVEAGAAFVKTSTGFSPIGATVHDIKLLARTVNDKVKIKAAGGIRHFEDAVSMIKAGASRIGASSSIQIMLEAGYTL